MRADQNIKISVIIAVYQRQQELKELLESLAIQTVKDFEVLVIDDGSKNPLESVVNKFKDNLDISYYFKENSGPGLSRNYGMERAKGNYFVFLDSDCIAPKNYIETVYNELNTNFVDGFGGPDSAKKDFNNLQKAISFAMTSMLTTGGVRGGTKNLEQFQPRSFNMGISKEAYLKSGGFSEMRIGEDPDLSLTLWELGFITRLFANAKVYHKRRTSLKKFAKQVYQFGCARPILNQRHPKYKKLVFWLPSLFLIGSLVSVLLLVFPCKLFLLPFGFLQLYFLLIFLVSSIQNRSLLVGFTSIITSAIQLYSYGFGYLKSEILINILGIDAQKAFPHHFHSENL